MIMATPTYLEAKKKFYATGYELRDYLARTISGKNPDGSTFEVAGGSGGGSVIATTIENAGTALTLTAPATGEKVYDLTLTEDCALTLVGGSSGYSASLTLRVRQGGTGNNVLTWLSTIDWSLSSEPILSTEIDQYDVIVLFTTDAGASWSGFLAGSALEGTAPPASTLPIFTAAPSITGSGIIGDTLTCNGGSVTGNPTPTKTYQWKNAGMDIGGATSSTYIVQSGDVGDALTCIVMATNTEGSASATSNTITGAASATAPAQPTSLALSPGNQQLGVSWIAPASNGGSVITTYLVEFRQPAGSGSYTTFVHGASTVPSITLTGLTNSTSCGVRVSAVNAIGTSSPTAEVTATPTGSAGTTPVWLKSAGLPGNGIAVDTWTNEGTLGSFTGSGGTRPTARTGESNGLSAAQFAGAHKLTGPDLSGLTQASFWVVCKFDTFGDGALWDMGTSQFGSAFPYGGQLYEDAGSSERAPVVNDIAATIGNVSSYFIYEVHATSSQYVILANGVQLYSGSNPGTVSLPVAPKIGNGAATAFMDGKIAELRIDSVVGDAAARTTIRQEIASRHAITLP